MRPTGVPRTLSAVSLCLLAVDCTGELGKDPAAEEEPRVLTRNCVEVVDERGARVRLGPDCWIRPPALPEPGRRAPGDGTAREEDDEPTVPPTGCPHEFFDSPAEPGSVRFAFSVWDPHTILVEPGVIHMDHDPDPVPQSIECDPFEDGHLCYGGHTGTDFMLGGVWWAMDGGVTVRAAAPGVVTDVVDGNFDRCHADLNPFSASFGGITCPDPEADAGADPDAVTPANLVSVCHADGTISRYAHLMNGSITVQVGDRVECGDPLGLVGSSGTSAAPHLHFDLTVPDEDSARRFVDPYASDPAESRWVDQRDAGWGTLPATSCES